MKLRRPTILSVPILALLLAGCGSTESGNNTTTSSAAAKPQIAFTSPAVGGNDLIPASYKCDDTKIWVPLRWGAVPAGTRELAFYIVRFGAPKLTSGSKVKVEVEAESLVVGVQPKLHSLAAGVLPHGVHVGVHRRGGQVLSICPPKGVTENLFFRIFALPRKLNLSGPQNRDLVAVMNNEALLTGSFIAHYRTA